MDAIWFCDIGQRLTCFDSCQFTIIWISSINLNAGCKPWLPYSLPSFPQAPALRSGRAGRTVTWLPNLGWKDYHIFLLMGLRYKVRVSSAQRESKSKRKINFKPSDTKMFKFLSPLSWKKKKTLYRFRSGPIPIINPVHRYLYCWGKLTCGTFYCHLLKKHRNYRSSVHSQSGHI